MISKPFKPTPVDSIVNEALDNYWNGPFKGLYATAREKLGLGEISRKFPIFLSVCSFYHCICWFHLFFSGSQSLFCGDFGWNSPKLAPREFEVWF